MLLYNRRLVNIVKEDLFIVPSDEGFGYPRLHVKFCVIAGGVQVTTELLLEGTAHDASRSPHNTGSIHIVTRIPYE